LFEQQLHNSLFENLEGEWLFDDENPIQITDTSGNNRNGLPASRTYACTGSLQPDSNGDGIPDKIFTYGSAVANGSGSHLYLDMSGSTDAACVTSIPNISAEGTVTFWLRYNNGANRSITSLINGTAQRINMRTASGLFRLGASNSDRIVAPESISDNQWHHIVASWSQSEDFLKLYIDGKLVDEIQYISVGSIASLGIAQGNIGMRVDDYRIYSAAY
jgi:hypothetical protein